MNRKNGMPRNMVLARGLAILELIIALSAFAGGIGLISTPDGSNLQLPPRLLESSPFNDFLIPGLLLFFAVGGSMLFGGAILLLHRRWAAEASFAAGAILFGWITIQVLMIRELSWLHYLYWGLGLATMALALLLWRTQRNWKLRRGL